MKEHCLKCASFLDGQCDCDGYHTFDELYEHRIILWIALCNMYYQWGYGDPWRSKLHSDGSSYDGWFLLGMGKHKSSQMTYHLPMSRWEDTFFAKTLDKAPEFDGHTSDDVLKRLEMMFKKYHDCGVDGHVWKAVGGRCCPKTYPDTMLLGVNHWCHQVVYVCKECGKRDDGHDGGPAFEECSKCKNERLQNKL